MTVFECKAVVFSYVYTGLDKRYIPFHDSYTSTKVLTCKLKNSVTSDQYSVRKYGFAS